MSSVGFLLRYIIYDKTVAIVESLPLGLGEHESVTDDRRWGGNAFGVWMEWNHAIFGREDLSILLRWRVNCSVRSRDLSLLFYLLDILIKTDKALTGGRVIYARDRYG
jgi:hypothetical protein